MPMLVSRADIEAAHRAARDAISYADRSATRHGRGEGAAAALTKTLEVGTMAFGLGVLKGRYGATALFNGVLPADLLLGVTGHILGFAGFGGRFNMDVHNLADGALVSYLTTLGAGLGGKWLESSGAHPGFTSSGQDKASGPARVGRANGGALPASQAPLTAAELAAMAHAVK